MVVNSVSKKEADLYEEKKLKLEKDLAEKKQLFEKEIAGREANIKETEIELKELRNRNIAFPGELEKAIASSVKAATEKLQTEFRFEKELTAKQTEGELRLKDQIVETLKNKIKDMEATIKELSQKTVTADANVKDIAIKAIESSSKIHFIEKPKDSQSKE